MDLPDTSFFPVGTHRVPEPEAGPLDLEARLLAHMEHAQPTLGATAEHLPAKLALRLFETLDGQVVYSKTYYDRAGVPLRSQVLTAKSLHGFVTTLPRNDVPTNIKEALLGAMWETMRLAQ